MKHVTIVIICICFYANAETFELFSKKSKDQTIYKNLKHNKINLRYSLTPVSRKKGGLSYRYFINKKFAPFLGFEYKFDSDPENDFENRYDISLGITYRFTRRTRTWVIFGDAGFNLNNERSDNKFGLAQGFVNIWAEYVFKNGFGVYALFNSRFPLKLEKGDSTVMISTTYLGFTYQFNLK